MAKNRIITVKDIPITVSEADIDDYVEKIRSQLKELLKNCDEIKLN